MIGGNDAQKKRWIPKLASGEWLGAWGLTEPGSGSDAGGMRTTAVKRDGGWVLNGSKTFITNGTYANCALVLAVTDKEKATHGGISAFLVERGTAGFRSGKKENKLGLRASDTAELIFENCFVPDDCLVGELGGGFKDAMRTLDGGRISIAALSLGMARGALDAAVKYSKQRKQFGKAISEFQAIGFKLADMATQLDAAWLLTMRAAQMKDQGKAEPAHISMLKMNNVGIALEIARKSRDILGANGIVDDYCIMRHMNNLESVYTYEGTNDIHKLVIGEKITGIAAFV